MRWLGRWLTHRSRVPRSLRMVIALVLGAAALAGLAASSPAASGPANPNSSAPAARTKNPFPPGAGNPAKAFPNSAMLRAQGMELYQQSCSSCHGLGLQGIKGVAPSLLGVGAGPPDFYLSTGRMPLQNNLQEPPRARPFYNREQINALVDFIASYGGPAAPTADPAKGNLSIGQQTFTLNCAGCHSMMARGGITLGAQAPSLQLATAQQIAEAVRFGPYLMPHFDANQIDQYHLDSLARYVLWTQRPNNAGGWGIDNIGPIPEGIVAWFIGVLALVIVARLIGETAAPSRPRPPRPPEA
jgi:ubiquinol-cytochrome c reductase cytochrome c subunit